MDEEKENVEKSLILNDTVEEKNPSTDNKKEEKTNSKQLYYLALAMAILVIVFFASYSIFSSFNSFEYQNLTFNKEKFGEIPLYHYYYFYNFEGQQYKYNLYLRNDPRKNFVPLTGSAINNVFDFQLGEFIYISLDPEESIVGCEYSSVGIASLSSFFIDNQLKVRSASTNKSVAEDFNIQYANCDTHHDRNVIVVKSGSETKVIRETPLCTIIEVSDCQVLEAVEKFQIEVLLDAREKGFNPL
jgi:hypothetical protein